MALRAHLSSEPCRDLSATLTEGQQYLQPAALRLLSRKQRAYRPCYHQASQREVKRLACYQI
jgi:hypothetical protein